jgi:predicted ATPase
MNSYKSEIRDSIIRELLERAKKGNYAKYLVSIRLERIRQFRGSHIRFDFPVTALIGPNGSGKSTILATIACAHKSINPTNFFFKTRISDTNMDNWIAEYEAIDRDQNATGSIRGKLQLQNNKWVKTLELNREIKLISITRTVPAVESPFFPHKKRLRGESQTKISVNEVQDIDVIKTESERILGKSLIHFKLLEALLTTEKNQPERLNARDKYGRRSYKVVYVTRKIERRQRLYIGSDGENEYSEFNFGSGEAAVIRMVADIESLPNYSLVLIEEIENGLHPIAVRHMTEYLIDVSKRKNLQVVFTTHSDYALAPLPSEAIWACLDGKLQQGKLSVEILRAVSGHIDKRLAIFVEDEFAKAWVEAILREALHDYIDEIGIYAVSGDGNAVKVHAGHISNPAVSFRSICFIDGDSKQKDDHDRGVFRLPGLIPESTVFNSVLANLDKNIALLTIACQRSPGKQVLVADEIRKVSRTNRDPHLLFNQVGLRIGLVSETIVRGAFLSIWIQDNMAEIEKIVAPITKALALPPKTEA